MIYLFEEGEYENYRVAAVYDVPDSVDISKDAWLISLGVSSFPKWENDLEKWETALKKWREERDLALQGLTDREIEIQHRAWIESNPLIRSLPFDMVT